MNGCRACEAQPGAPCDIQWKVGSDIDPRSADEGRNRPNDQAPPPAEVGARSSRKSDCVRGVTRNEAVVWRVCTPQRHRSEKCSRPLPPHHGLDHFRQNVRARAAQRQVECEPLPAPVQSGSRGSGDCEQLAHLHNEPQRGVEHLWQPVDASEDCILKGADTARCRQATRNEQNNNAACKAHPVGTPGVDCFRRPRACS